MKASLKFREDQKPLFRAKVPLNILGFPFQSGVSAGDSKELSLNLTTFFESGPSLKLSYKPNDSFNPFTLVVKTGIGAFGSPISAPLSMSAEFNLVGRGNGNPSFFLQFRPQLGDFSFKKSTTSLPISPILQKSVKFCKDVESEGEESVEGIETPLDNGVYKPESGFFHMIEGNAVGGIHRLVNGVEVGARTVLPIRNRAVLKCRWGVKFPEEMKTVLENGKMNPMAGISFKKIPFLVMNKIAIEHVAEDAASKEKSKRDCNLIAENADVAEACFAVKRQLEGLQMENGLLRKSVEGLRSELGVGLSDSGQYKNGGKYSSAKNEKKGSEFAGKGSDLEVKDELKKI